ncbi:Hsp20/alpha crystallin family protein [Synechococcus elongatus]|uniref:Hsp20/alpha crystallin family protein n=1 Tax=Synechococcus elongatus TaxID=32046 RepID=UPI001EE0EDE5|nr:Hsp20/alpha crystallin family protein [Synechococcus elongatus]
MMLRLLHWRSAVPDPALAWTPIVMSTALQMEETPTTLRLSLPLNQWDPKTIRVQIEDNCLRLQGYNQLCSPYGSRWQVAQQLLTLPCRVRADQYLTAVESDRLVLTLIKVQPQASLATQPFQIWELWKQAWQRGRHRLGQQLRQWSDRLLTP